MCHPRPASSSICTSPSFECRDYPPDAITRRLSASAAPRSAPNPGCKATTGADHQSVLYRLHCACPARMPGDRTSARQQRTCSESSQAVTGINAPSIKSRLILLECSNHRHEQVIVKLIFSLCIYNSRVPYFHHDAIRNTCSLSGSCLPTMNFAKIRC